MFGANKNLQIKSFDIKKFNFLGLIKKHLKDNINCNKIENFLQHKI